MFANFEVIPAVDLQEGQVVQLVGGERGTEREYGDPLTAAKGWVEEGARTLHLVDLDGAFEGERTNAAAVSQVVRATEIPIQLGGGIRSAATARELLASGVDRVILGTAAIEEPEIVARVSEHYPEGVIVSLDAKAGEVVIAGWTESTGLAPAAAVREYEKRGAAAILCTDVDSEGRLKGVETELIERVVDATSIPVIASGGVATIEDIRALYDAGAAAVVVGSALYEGRFTLEEAIAAVETTDADG